MQSFQVFLVATLGLVLGLSPLMAQTLAKNLSPAEEKERIARWKLELRELWRIDHESDPEMLLMARLAEASAYRKAVEALGKEVKVNKTTAHVLLDLKRRLTTAELMVAKMKRIVALEDCWIIAKKAEAIHQASLNSETAGSTTADKKAMVAYQLTVGRSLFEFALVMAMKAKE